MVRNNIQLTLSSLTDKEMQTLRYIQENIMKPLNNADWGHYEMELFKKSLI